MKAKRLIKTAAYELLNYLFGTLLPLYDGMQWLRLARPAADGALQV